MVKKTSTKPAKTNASRKPAANHAKKAAGPGKNAKPEPSLTLTPTATEPCPVLAEGEIQKIQGLLKANTADGVTLGLSLLESLTVTTADYETVFTESVIISILDDWIAESWGAVAKALLPHGAVSDTFQKIAEEKFRKRPQRHSMFKGLLHARAPVARAAFLASWSGKARPAKPFLDLVAISAGSFTMGSPKDEAARSDTENQVEVRITKPFKMGQTAVTQSQWRAVMGTEPWRYEKLSKKECGDDLPAVYVSWDDANVFCHTLTGLERETGHLQASQCYRLPTEAEWEYACRANTVTAYSFGNSPASLAEYGWYDSNSDGKLRAVAKKKPNPWGLFDMHGNVWEWCSDRFADSLLGGVDPTGPSDGPSRVFRGGFFGFSAPYCRSAFRFGAGPSGCDATFGFRVVLCD
jgi:formylglycine-generating enzyme required for sulfatase activity